MPTITEDMLNPRQLSELAGVKLGTVHTWRKRRATTGMPDPNMVVGRTPLWTPETIMPWLKATNRIK